MQKKLFWSLLGLSKLNVYLKCVVWITEEEKVIALKKWIFCIKIDFAKNQFFSKINFLPV